MKMIRLGADGPETSQFGLGAMSFAGIYGDATIGDRYTPAQWEGPERDC